MTCRKCNSSRLMAWVNPKNPKSKEIVCLNCGERQEGDCTTCVYAGRPMYEYPCNECGRISGHKMYEPVETKYKRVKKMDAEQLAEWLVKIGWDCNNCSECERLSDSPLSADERCDEKCVEHCLNWLQQPVEAEK